MSENKLSKKYIGSDQVGSSQIELENDSAIRAKSADGLSSEAILKLDPSNLLQMLLHPYLPGAATSPDQAARQQEVNEVAYDVGQLEIALGTAQSDISALEAREYIFQYDSLAQFPPSGISQRIYVAMDSEKIYRWKEEVIPSEFDFIIGAGGDFATLEAALASPSVVDGMNLQILDGTYESAAAISISKKVKIYGQSRAGVILQTAASTAAPVSFINISVNDVLLKDMTIKHRKTNNTSVEAAITVSGGGFPQTRVSGFIMDNCLVEHVEFGVVVRGEAWKVSNSTISYMGGTNSTRRHMGVYGFKSNCFIVGNVFADNAASGTVRAIAITSTTGSNPNETNEGALVVENNTQSGPMAQFISQDNFQGSANSYELFVKGNIINETSAFVSFFGVANNFGDIISQVIAQNNTLSNQHSGGGKGLIGIDGSGTISFRSSNLPVHASGNILGQLIFRADYAEASGSIGAIVGFKSAVFGSMTVSQDSVIPSFPAVIPTPSMETLIQEYVELSPTDLAPILADIADLQAEDLTFLKLDGSRAMTGALSMGSFKISSLADPTLAQDAATKAYVDSQISGAGLSGGNAISISSGVVNALFDNSTITLNGSNQLQVSSTVMSKISTLESEMDAVQADVLSLDGRVDALEASTASIQSDVNVLIPQMSQAQADILSLDGRVDTLESEMDAAQASIISLDGRLDIIEPKVSTLESEMDAAQAGIAVLEERSEIITSTVYNSFASVYADGQPGILDPSSTTNPRKGWYYTNSVAGQKINWYFFDGTTQANISLGNFSSYAVMTFDNVRSPILAVYTVPTGTNDFLPGFAHSRVVYSGFDGASPAVGQKCVVYFGEEPIAHPELPKFKLLKVAALSGGDQDPSEQVLTTSFGSDSGAAVGAIQYMVESLGIESPSWRGEAELEIRPLFREIDNSLNMLAAKISNLADPSEAQDAATKAYVDAQISAGTDFEIQKVVLSAQNIIDQFIDLNHLAIPGSVICSSDRINLITVLGPDADADFEQNNSGAVTRLAFQGPSASAGTSPLEEGQIVYINYVRA